MEKLKITLLLFSFPLIINAQSASDIVKKADAKMRGEESGFSEMTLKIIRPGWDRTISLKSWNKGTDYSLSLVTAPPKEKGQSFLKREKSLWNWNPTINRMIKLPPSMLSQGWMGSDYTNDDLLNESSVVVDYIHTLEGKEMISGEECYKIKLIPKENAPVVWGKIMIWISVNEYLQLKNEYYDEDDYLVKTEIGKEIKNMDGRLIPTVFEIIPADEEGHKTILIIDKIEFNINISDNFFSQQNMKRVK